MRTIILSAVAVVASSTLAFFAGAHSGLSLGGSQTPECTAQPPQQAAPAAAAEGAVEADTKPAQEGGEEGAKADDAKAVADTDVWPYREWAVEAETEGARVFSKTRFLWIRPEPKKTTAFLGYLSLGESVRFKGGSKEAAFAAKSRSTRCEAWYAVEPRGYICINEDDVAYDADDPIIVKLRATKANRLSPWPYEYGESRSTPVYSTIPPKHRQRRAESGLEDHLRKVREARGAKSDEQIAQIDQQLLGVTVKLTGREAPSLFRLGPRGRTTKTKIVRNSTVAFVDTFDAQARSWLLTWDRGIVPADRIAKYPKSSFHGVALTKEMRLPIAFFRSEHPKYRRTDDGKVVETGESWARHAYVQLTEETIDFDDKRFLLTKEDGLLCSVDDISVARRSHLIPPRIEQMDKGRRTWIDVSVLNGWLVAYEYDKPVYATMVSPGRGGVPKDGVDPLETASTPVGRYRITGKFVTATMISNASKDIVHDEVMYTQNFTGPYALHGAYWHDDWGKGKSGGCVNLAPIDARRLFAWTEPELPAGWHAVQLATGYKNALEEYQRATLVYVHK